MKLVYIAGPYSANRTIDIEQNILNAKRAALRIIENGDFPVCPHSNTALFEIHFPTKPDDFWLDGTMRMMERCDYIHMLDNWESSSGSIAERERAIKLEIPFYFLKRENENV